MNIKNLIKQIILEELENQITDTLTNINLTKQPNIFDNINNRRFMLNVNTKDAILGDEWKILDRIGFSSHAQEYYNIKGTNTNFDSYVKGWIGGKSKKYKNGIIHFAPPLDTSNIDQFDKVYEAIQIFLKCGATSDTVLRGVIIKGKSEEIKIKKLM